jgi:hypothetical protein
MQGEGGRKMLKVNNGTTIAIIVWTATLITPTAEVVFVVAIVWILTLDIIITTTAEITTIVVLPLEVTSECAAAPSMNGLLVGMTPM